MAGEQEAGREDQPGGAVVRTEQRGHKEGHGQLAVRGALGPASQFGS